MKRMQLQRFYGLHSNALALFLSVVDVYILCRVRHSENALKMLDSLPRLDDTASDNAPQPITDIPVLKGGSIRDKLFTHEDANNVHKLFGVFILAHFIFRFSKMVISRDPCGGLCTPNIFASIFIILGKPCMIWYNKHTIL